MKRLLIIMACALLPLLTIAQVKSGDAALDKRLSDYLKYTRELNFSALMDYLHPNLFKIASKEAIQQSFEQAFQSEEMEIAITEIHILAIGKPFNSKGASYSKVDYSMQMYLLFKDTTVLSTPDFVPNMLKAFESAFAGKKTKYDASTHRFIVEGPDVLYAIKDDAQTPWMFVGYKKDKTLLETIFPQEVIAHFNML
jgi:hypothetical protein